MGDQSTKMKYVLLLVAVALLATLTFAEEIPENVLLEVQSDVEMMKKKGATEADCKDLAKTTCKEVLSDSGNSQKVIDRQSSGAECTKLFQKTINILRTNYYKQVKLWNAYKKAVTRSASARVAIGSRKFRELKPGKCGFVFTSKYYLAAKRRYNHYVTLERTYRGRVYEAKKAWTTARKTQKNMQEKCRCKVVKRRDTLWKTVNNSAKRAKAAKALAKCKMMQCVLAGTPPSNKKCKAVLPKLRNKKLDRLTEHAHSSGICHRRHRENVVKEKANKREKHGKQREKLAKARARRQEQARKAKIREQRAKAVKREQQAKARAREQRAKHHEKRSKAAEKLAKERSRKIAAERSHKARERSHKATERRNKQARLRVINRGWTGWANNWDGALHYAHTGNNGYFINGIGGVHHNGKEDRLFKFHNMQIGSRIRQHRYVTGYVNNWDGYMQFTCPGDRVITGFRSYHHNGREDRRWRVECSSFAHLGVRKGGWPGWQTSWDAPFHIGCGNRPMVGISSTHNNHKEDRIWRVQCGSFYAKRL